IEFLRQLADPLGHRFSVMQHLILMAIGAGCNFAEDRSGTLKLVPEFVMAVVLGEAQYGCGFFHLGQTL
ncbi:hypothetical protein ABTM17_19280, partial [Acinetobacter baumannii]